MSVFLALSKQFCPKSDHEDAFLENIFSLQCQTTSVVHTCQHWRFNSEKQKNAEEIPKIICFWPFLGENMQIRVLGGGGG